MAGKYTHLSRLGWYIDLNPRIRCNEFLVKVLEWMDGGDGPRQTYTSVDLYMDWWEEYGQPQGHLN